MAEYDVVIVGIGPVGATLANLLANRGVSVLVLERAAAMYPLPRAVHFDDETMRVFQAVGADIAAQIDAVVHINPGMQFVDKQGAMILDWPRPNVVTPNGWNASYRFHQPDVEGILADAAQAEPPPLPKRAPGLVTVTRGAAVVGIEERAGGADEGGAVVVRHRPWDYSLWAVEEGSAVSTVTAKYVVGCDGAGSFVRKSMAAALGADADAAVLGEACTRDTDNMEDIGWSQRWLVVDAVLKRDMVELGDHTRQTCNRSRPSTYTRQPGEPTASASASGPIIGSRVRWEVAILPDETNDQITDLNW